MSVFKNHRPQISEHFSEASSLTLWTGLQYNRKRGLGQIAFSQTKDRTWNLELNLELTLLEGNDNKKD